MIHLSFTSYSNLKDLFCFSKKFGHTAGSLYVFGSVLTVNLHPKWHGTLPVYPMVRPSVGANRTLKMVPLDFFYSFSDIRYHDGTLIWKSWKKLENYKYFLEVCNWKKKHNTL